MLWDCRFCSTKKLLGVTHRHCPNCGAAQDPAWRYFPAEADMVELKDHKYVGADKVCPACSQPNSAASTYCSECGADLATGKVAQVQADRIIGTGVAESDTRHDVVKERFDAEMKRVGAAPASKPILLGLRKKELAIIGGVVLLALLVIGIVYAVTYRNEVSGSVTAMSWERTIDIQDFQPRGDSGWDETVPGDAYGRSCVQKQRSTRQVASGSHQECKDVDQGDGSFRRECHSVTDYRDEPVYDQWCTYTVDRWAYRRSAKASGNGEQPPPAWPAYTLASGTGRYGQEKAGGQHESYTVAVRDSDGKERRCDFDQQSKWSQYDVGMKVRLKVTITGSPDCDTLKIVR
jgi:hypothetical protein